CPWLRPGGQARSGHSLAQNLSRAVPGTAGQARLRRQGTRVIVHAAPRRCRRESALQQSGPDLICKDCRIIWLLLAGRQGATASTPAAGHPCRAVGGELMLLLSARQANRRACQARSLRTL